MPGKWSQVVKAHDVVTVRMGNEYGIELAEFGSQALFAEVRSAVDNPLGAVGSGKVDGASFSLVTGVVGRADFAITTDYRNADRCAGSEKSNFHSCHC